MCFRQSEISDEDIDSFKKNVTISESDVDTPGVLKFV